MARHIRRIDGVGLITAGSLQLLHDFAGVQRRLDAKTEEVPCCLRIRRSHVPRLCADSAPTLVLSVDSGSFVSVQLSKSEASLALLRQEREATAAAAVTRAAVAEKLQQLEEELETAKRDFASQQEQAAQVAASDKVGWHVCGVCRVLMRYVVCIARPRQHAASDV